MSLWTDLSPLRVRVAQRLTVVSISSIACPDTSLSRAIKTPTESRTCVARAGWSTAMISVEPRIALGALCSASSEPTKAYLIDGIEAVAGDEVIIETSDATRPATIRSGEADTFRYLLMPVRVT